MKTFRIAEVQLKIERTSYCSLGPLVPLKVLLGLEPVLAELLVVDYPDVGHRRFQRFHAHPSVWVEQHGGAVLRWLVRVHICHLQKRWYSHSLESPTRQSTMNSCQSRFLSLKVSTFQHS